jgi:hypothetical protein
MVIFSNPTCVGLDRCTAVEIAPIGDFICNRRVATEGRFSMRQRALRQRARQGAYKRQSDPGSALRNSMAWHGMAWHGRGGNSHA